MRCAFGHETGRRGCRRPGSGSVAIYSPRPRSRGGAGLAPRFRIRNRPPGCGGPVLVLWWYAAPAPGQGEGPGLRRAFGHETGRRGCRRPGSGLAVVCSPAPGQGEEAGLAPRFRKRKQAAGLRRSGSGSVAIYSPRPRSRGGGRACAALSDMEQAAGVRRPGSGLVVVCSPAPGQGEGPGLRRTFEKGNRPPGVPAACCWLQGLTAPGALLFSPCPCLPFPGAFPGGASARRPRSLSGPRSSPPAPAGR